MSGSVPPTVYSRQSVPLPLHYLMVSILTYQAFRIYTDSWLGIFDALVYALPLCIFLLIFLSFFLDIFSLNWFLAYYRFQNIGNEVHLPIPTTILQEKPDGHYNDCVTLLAS